MKALALLALALLLAGCSSGGGSAGTTPGQDAEGNYVIHMQAPRRFEPVDATVPTGATVKWVNDDTTPHDVTGTDAGSPLQSPRVMAKGATYKVTFHEPGTYHYECTLHSGMEGTIHVTGESHGDGGSPSGSASASGSATGGA